MMRENYMPFKGSAVVALSAASLLFYDVKIVGPEVWVHIRPNPIPLPNDTW